MRNTNGKVYLIGAGPGDPDLLTLRAIRCLRCADVVLYDYLANEAILEHTRSDAELICLGRHGQGRVMTQEQINAQVVAEALAGKTVARLKGGDPAVFARTAEEVAALSETGVPYEIIPGVTAALAVSSYAGISLTHRDTASAVAFVTGQERGDKEPPALDYNALAKFPGTLVVYMGVTTIRAWTSKLIAAGKPAETPVAIVRRCSWPNQETVRCELGSVADEIVERRLRPPAVIILGEVVSEMRETSWFTERPLFGQRVLLTRPKSQNAEMRSTLAELGADVLVQPAIEIREPDDWSVVDAAISRLHEFDWLVFSSSNGVRYLVSRIIARCGDVRPLAAVNIAAIGPGTAEALAEYHLRADLVPDEYRAEALAAALVAEANVAGKRFLLARASRGREVLAETLCAAGGEVEQIVVYRSTDVTMLDDDVAAALDSGSVDWITVTSSAIAHSLARLLGERLKKCRLASISPITSNTLRELGLEPTAEAATYTMDGVIDAILAAKGASR